MLPDRDFCRLVCARKRREEGREPSVKQAVPSLLCRVARPLTHRGGRGGGVGRRGGSLKTRISTMQVSVASL